jgi:hypothetical protein
LQAKAGANIIQDLAYVPEIALARVQLIHPILIYAGGVVQRFPTGRLFVGVGADVIALLASCYNKVPEEVEVLTIA